MEDDNQSATMAVKGRSPASSNPPVRETRATPFKRGRSKVFYASDEHSMPKFSLSQSATDILKNSFAEGDECDVTDTEPLLWRNTLDTCKETSEGSSSGDETASPTSSTGIRSPIGSIRSSLGGSLRGSQDSGYSDSGESNSGGAQELDRVESPLRVKHISRVFFGSGSGRARLYSDTIVTSPTINLSKSKISESNNNSLSRRHKSCSTQVESPDSNSSSRSSPTSFCDSDEPQYQLENKSILDISSSSYDEQASRRTGAIRKSSYVNILRKGTRRSTSADKLLDEPKTRKPCIMKARRRWSTVDPKASILKADARSSENLYKENLGQFSSLGVLHETSLSCSHIEQIQAVVSPRKTNVKRLRIHPTAIAAEMKNGAVGQWLVEVRQRSDTECMNTLQSKSLATDAPHDPLSAVGAVRAVQKKAHAVSTEFARLCHKLEQHQLCRLPSLCRSLVALINSFLREPPGPSALTAGPKSHLARQIEVVRQICHRLMEITTSYEQQLLSETNADSDKSVDKITINHTFEKSCNNSSVESQHEENQEKCIPNGNSPIIITDDEKLSDSSGDSLISAADVAKEIAQVVTALGHAFTKLVDIMLSMEIKEIISCMEAEKSSSDSVRSSLRQVTSLGVDGGHICRLIAKLGGVRALLALCLEHKRRSLRVAALRALATVCCVAEGISHLEKAGGIEVIVDILCAEDSPEDEQSEAAAVLAQITSPWVEDNHSIVGLHPHVSAVVTALTGLVKSTESAEIFLLGSAALANLTFLTNEGCVSALLKAGTAGVLLGAASETNGLSVFTKDQIATVIASLCSSPEGAAAVSREGGVTTLIGLLNTRPPPHPARMPEVTAAERVQQKSAIALSRLCSDAATSSSVLAAGGGCRLVMLCKDEQERNHSDAVLVACLAALRKIASSCDRSQLRAIGAGDLVEPRLLDSFLTFSSRQESYV